MSSRVSVVIATYNCARFLRESVGSVLEQTRPAREIIVVDDGSTDNTSELLDAFGDRIRVVRQVNSGVAIARNRGMELATGEYVAAQDADDISRSTRLEAQESFLDQNPDVVAVGCNMDRIDRDGKFLGSIAYAEDDATIRFRLLTNSSLPHPGIMLRRRAALAVGGYDPRFRMCQDYDLWCRLSDRGRLANLPETLVNYRWHGENVTVRSPAEGQSARQEISRRHLLRTGFAKTSAEADAFFAAYTGDARALTSAGAAACRAVWARFLETVDAPEFRGWLRSLCLAKAEESGPTRGAFLRWIQLARSVDPEQMRWDRLATRALGRVRDKILDRGNRSPSNV